MPNCLHAQDSSRDDTKYVGTVGIFAKGNLNRHSANFQTLPGVPSCCPRYESGLGEAPAFGLSYARPLSGQFSSLVQLGYNSLDATLRKDEFTTVLLAGVSTEGEFEHTVNASIGSLTFAPMLAYGIGEKLSVQAGPSLSYILSNTYQEHETLLQPGNAGTFENGRRSRNELSGATPNANKLLASITAGVSYHLPLDRSGDLELIPEIGYSYGLTPIVKGMHWYASTWSAGATVGWKLSRSNPPLPPPPVAIVRPEITVPVVARHPILRASLSAVTVDSNRREQPIDQLLIEDYIRTQYRPLLNFVFFAEGSAVIPSRYHSLGPEERGAFEINRLNELETLPLYYEMMNILGKRMQLYPHGRITIVGCNANVGKELGNRQLSKARAENIYAYFRDTWKISPDRMKIEVRNLPEKPSSVNDTDGVAEDRRVEIYSNLWEVMEPVFTVDTAHVPKPPVVRFLPKAEAEAGLTGWQLGVASTRKIKDYSGKDTLPAHLDWELEKERERTLAALDTVNASLALSDMTRQTAESPLVTLPVRHYTLEEKHHEGSIDTIISRYSLILFDFDRGELSGANRKIATFVKNRISDKARVSIYGYTDRIGTDTYNQQLSEQRAISTQRMIGFDKAEVKGLGRSVLLHDNSLPEGRFYSRTVTVVVSTPTIR